MFPRATFQIFPRPGGLGIVEESTATRGQRLLFFTDFCFACCALLFYFLFLSEKESKEIVENKKTINIYVYVYMIFYCIYIIV